MYDQGDQAYCVVENACFNRCVFDIENNIEGVAFHNTIETCLKVVKNGNYE